MLALDFMHMGLLSLLRNLACSELLVPVFGLSCAGFVFLLSAIDYVTLGLFLPSQLLACMGSSPFALDFLHLESPLLLKCSSRIGPSLPVLSCGRMSLLLLVLDPVHPGLPISVRSLARLSLVMSTSDSCSLGLSMPSHVFA